LSGRGLETDAILHSLTGVGSIEIADGRLQGVNIAEDVLGGVTVIGGLTSWLSPEVKRKHPRLFSKQDTDFQTAEMTLHVKDGRIRADALAIETDDFSLLGAGTIGLDGSLDIEADFRTSIALASTLVGVADPTRYLLNGEKRIAIPVHITGELGAPRVRPDQNFIASTLTRATLGTVKTIVGDLIGKPGSNARSSKTPTGAAAPGAGAGEEGGQATEQSAAGESESPPAAKPEARPKRKSVEGVLEQGLQDLLKPRSTETPKN
jgi:hypothetical protein